MINLSNLIELHESDDAIRRHKRILEELFYLCINESFEQTIIETRERLTAASGEQGIDLSFPCIFDSAVEVRRILRQIPNFYKELLLSIADSHRYYHPSFLRDYSKVASDADMSRKFSILENIIFFNNPIPNNDAKGHFKLASGYMEIADDEIDGSYIRMHFDLGTTKNEMLSIIEKRFPETNELQIEKYNIKNQQRFKEDNNLPLKAEIYRLSEQGLNDTQIAIHLENNGYRDDISLDAVRMHRTRLIEESERFDPNR
ncbi:MAG: hypothetical protein RLZZ70_149 [Candidatus Parcubacteria bacterium]